MIGSRDTRKYQLSVDVCAEPEDQVWYVVQEPFSSETDGILQGIAGVVASPSEQLQVIRPGDPGTSEASYVLTGTAISEQVHLRKWTNQEEQAKYVHCVESARQAARVVSGLLGAVTGRFGNIVQGSGNCGPRPRQRSGTMLSLRAIFLTRVCDSFMNTLQ